MAAAFTPAPEARHARRWQILRNLGWLISSSLLAFSLLLLLDRTFTFSLPLRIALLLGLLALIGGLAWQWLIRPLQVTLNPTLAVRASNRTTQQALAPPRRAALRSASFALIGVLAFGVALAVVPGTGDRLRRVAMPWHRLTPPATYRVVVSSGQPVVKRGDPVTLSAYLTGYDPTLPEPESAELVIRPVNGAEQRLAMSGDATAAYHATLPATTSDFEYRVEVGTASSEWFRVLVADPVELTPDSFTLVTPPVYSRSASRQVALASEQLDGLQHSTATAQMHFNRPAHAALLEWFPQGKEDEPGTLLPLALDDARQRATTDFTLLSAGTLKLTLWNEEGPRRVRTVKSIRVRVQNDAPPRLTQVVGLWPRSWLVRPDAKIIIWLMAQDDLGISGAEVEYAVGPEFRPVRVPFPNVQANAREISSTLPFDFAGLAAEGQTIRLRLRVADSRRIDSARLTPHVTVYPPAGWTEFTLSTAASSLVQQEIFGQRDELRDAFLTTIKELATAREEIREVCSGARDASPLPIDHRIRITRSREALERALARLISVQGEVERTPELRQLAAALQNDVLVPLRNLEAAIGHAAVDNPEERAQQLTEADDEFKRLHSVVESLLGRNFRLAQYRFDRRLLEGLTRDQLTLAERSEADEPRDALLKSEEELLNRFRAAVAQSDSLSRGHEFASGREARTLAAELRELTVALRDLDTATQALADETRRGLLALAGELQAECSASAAVLLERIDLAARLVGLAPPRPEEFRRIADLIARDKIVEALIELEKLAANLDRLAAEFEKWDADRADPKQAALQFARWQEDLHTRFDLATREVPFAKLPDAVKQRFRLEQRAIRDATIRLRLPRDPQSVSIRASALLALGRVIEEMDGEGTSLGDAFVTAVHALEKLAADTPALAVRRAASQKELDAIRLEHDSLLVAVEQQTRPVTARPIDALAMQELSKRLASHTEKQQKLAERLAALDLPGLEQRQNRCVAALRSSAADMNAGLPFDIPVSLKTARRELDRLKQALDNPPTPDEQAIVLAGQQARLAKELTAFGAVPTEKQMESLAFQQREIKKRLEALLAPEAAVLLHEADEAVKQAEAGFRDGSPPEELLQRVAKAADALQRLAERMRGRESQFNGVKRLIENRTRAIEDAKNLAGKPRAPVVSNTARRQLQREVDDLNHLRVGLSGQPIKQRVLRLYADLISQSEPDRLAGAHQALADALSELAETMKDVQELTAVDPGAKVGAAPSPEDAFLPSLSRAAALRALSGEQRAVRDRLNRVGAEVVRLTQPAAIDTLGELARRQSLIRVHLEQIALERPDLEFGSVIQSAKLAETRISLGRVPLAREAAQLTVERLRAWCVKNRHQPKAATVATLLAEQESFIQKLPDAAFDSPAIAARLEARQHELRTQTRKLAMRLESAATPFEPNHASALSLKEAASRLVQAEVQLKDAGMKGNFEASKLRMQATLLIDQAADHAALAGGLKPGIAMPPEPPLAIVTTGDALWEAELALKEAARELGPTGDLATARSAMHKVVAALRRVQESLVER